MECYIVNHFDRPCEKLIAIKVRIGALVYLKNPLWGDMRFPDDTITSLKDFGFDIKQDGKVLKFNKIKKSHAKYSNGRTRHWQGSKKFQIEIKEEINRRL